ncbi:MAG: glycosyltransferase family 4 protein [Pseudomonadota bacterium]|nr:glycosyltransferase family 4 protein [Pseudomonadota bacterium]
MSSSRRRKIDAGARPDSQRVAVISANTSWNLINFRRNVIAVLQAKGFRVVAVAPLDDHSAALADLGVEFRAIEMQNAGLSPYRDAKLFLQYVQILRDIRPQIYLGFTIKPNVYGSLAAGMTGSAVINNITGLGTVFTRTTLLTRFVIALYRLSLRRSSTVFFQNRDDLALFARHRIVRAEQSRLLPGSGVDLDRFRPGPATAGGGGAGFRFLLVARLLWDKGIGQYVEAAAIVRAAEPNVRCQILGFAEADSRDAVPRATLDRWVGEGAIEFLGAAEDVRPHLAAADCVVLPSYYREGTPRSLLEAAASGKPIITTDAPGMRDVVDNGLSGYLCAPRDACSLADAMLKMIRLPAGEREEMGKAGRRKAEREFSQDVVTEEYAEAIARAVRGA